LTHTHTPSLSLPLTHTHTPSLSLSVCRKVNKCYRGRSCPIIVHCRQVVPCTHTHTLSLSHTHTHTHSHTHTHTHTLSHTHTHTPPHLPKPPISVPHAVNLHSCGSNS